MIDFFLNGNSYIFIYIFGFYIVFASYFVFDSFFKKYSSKYKLLNNDQQMYTVSNILKSTQLCIISPFAIDILYQTMYLDQWNNNYIKNVGILYAIPDGVSLLMVNKMDLTTKIHHSIVCIFNIISINNNYEVDNVIRCMIVYACFSCFAYIVNLLLGLRYINNNAKVSLMLSRCAFIIYSLCCIINWSWHIKHLNTLVIGCENIVCKITIPTYYIFVTALAIDDIKLNKWLYKKSFQQNLITES